MMLTNVFKWKFPVEHRLAGTSALATSNSLSSRGQSGRDFPNVAFRVITSNVYLTEGYYARGVIPRGITHSAYTRGVRFDFGHGGNRVFLRAAHAEHLEFGCPEEL